MESGINRCFSFNFPWRRDGVFNRLGGLCGFNWRWRQIRQLIAQFPGARLRRSVALGQRRRAKAKQPGQNGYRRR